MKNFILKKVGPVLAGLVVSSAVMMTFEYVNSKIFEFPEGMDTENLEQVRAFAETLPWQAYILVFTGWMIGAFIGAWVTEKLSKEKKYVLSLALAIILSFAAILNYIMLKDAILFYFATIPLFFVTTYLGFKAANK